MDKRITTAAKCVMAVINGAWADKELYQICRAAIARVRLRYRTELTPEQLD